MNNSTKIDGNMNKAILGTNAMSKQPQPKNL